MKKFFQKLISNLKFTIWQFRFSCDNCKYKHFCRVAEGVCRDFVKGENK